MTRQLPDCTAVDAAAAARADTVDLAQRTAQIMVAIAATYTKAAATYRRLAHQRGLDGGRFHQHAARLDQRAARARRFAECERDYSNRQLSLRLANSRANRTPAQRVSATGLSPVIAIRPEVVVDGPDHPHCVVLRLRGRLSLRSNARIRHAIAESLTGTGRVLIDLSGLPEVPTPLLTLFPAALAAAGGWPRARLVLFGGAPCTRGARFGPDHRNGAPSRGLRLGSGAAGATATAGTQAHRPACACQRRGYRQDVRARGLRSLVSAFQRKRDSPVGDHRVGVQCRRARPHAQPTHPHLYRNGVSGRGSRLLHLPSTDPPPTRRVRDAPRPRIAPRSRSSENLVRRPSSGWQDDLGRPRHRPAILDDSVLHS